ncbi:hypothetical protein ANCDUO_17712 [Ancylostoma duodenale]|uniref:Uncharacterized protein n=1 Tax=Ancylostoma duodenale TaxID=51022 RepID=A0A0C2C7C5_9BILA|nr:hypothetical protein ANCDUO_17712 [Ancylostoma duodenale]
MSGVTGDRGQSVRAVVEVVELCHEFATVAQRNASRNRPRFWDSPTPGMGNFDISIPGTGQLALL